MHFLFTVNKSCNNITKALYRAGIQLMLLIIICCTFLLQAECLVSVI